MDNEFFHAWAQEKTSGEKSPRGTLASSVQSCVQSHLSADSSAFLISTMGVHSILPKCHGLPFFMPKFHATKKCYPLKWLNSRFTENTETQVVVPVCVDDNTDCKRTCCWISTLTCKKHLVKKDYKKIYIKKIYTSIIRTKIPGFTHTVKLFCPPFEEMQEGSWKVCYTSAQCKQSESKQMVSLA